MIADREDSEEREGGKEPPGRKELPALGTDPLNKADSVGKASPPENKEVVHNPQQHTEPVTNIMKAMEVVLSMTTAGGIGGELFCFQAIFPVCLQAQGLDPLMVYKATSDPATMYMHEVMRQKDAAEFRKAM